MKRAAEEGVENQVGGPTAGGLVKGQGGPGREEAGIQGEAQGQEDQGPVGQAKKNSQTRRGSGSHKRSRKESNEKQVHERRMSVVMGGPIFEDKKRSSKKSGSKKIKCDEDPKDIPEGSSSESIITINWTTEDDR